MEWGLGPLLSPGSCAAGAGNLGVQSANGSAERLGALAQILISRSGGVAVSASRDDAAAVPDRTGVYDPRERRLERGRPTPGRGSTADAAWTVRAAIHPALWRLFLGHAHGIGLPVSIQQLAFSVDMGFARSPRRAPRTGAFTPWSGPSARHDIGLQRPQALEPGLGSRSSRDLRALHHERRPAQNCLLHACFFGLTGGRVAAITAPADLFQGRTWGHHGGFLDRAGVGAAGGAGQRLIFDLRAATAGLTALDRFLVRAEYSLAAATAPGANGGNG